MDTGRQPSVSSPGATGPPAPALDLALTQSQFSWMRTRLSVERTLMSWVRTGVSLIGFGFTIYQFFQKLQEATAPEAAYPQAPRNLGLALIGAGILALVLALWQYQSVVSYLRSPEYSALVPDELHVPFRGRQSVWVTVILALIGVVAFLWIVVRG